VSDTDPPRCSECGVCPPELARLLSAAQHDVATDAQLSELGSRLGLLLGGSPLPLHTTPLLVTLSVATAIALLAAAGAGYIRRREHRVLPRRLPRRRTLHCRG
jgi:hypothetical protein